MLPEPHSSLGEFLSIHSSVQKVGCDEGCDDGCDVGLVGFEDGCLEGSEEG